MLSSTSRMRCDGPEKGTADTSVTPGDDWWNRTSIITPFSDSVFKSLHALMTGTVGTAVEGAVILHPMTDDLAVAMGTGRGHQMDGALERVEDMTLTLVI